MNICNILLTPVLIITLMQGPAGYIIIVNTIFRRNMDQDVYKTITGFLLTMIFSAYYLVVTLSVDMLQARVRGLTYEIIR